MWISVCERNRSPKNNKDLFIDTYNHITTLTLCLCSSVVRINRTYDVNIIYGVVLS